MILLVLASGCLFLSMLIIMPVVTKVHQDKDKLLSLFLLIDGNDIKEQMKKCKDFFNSTFHNEEKGVGNGDDGFDSDDEEKKEEGKNPSSDEMKKLQAGNPKKFMRKNKKLKKYSTNYFALLVKSLAVIVFLESYFLYQYF
jgi:hypothetical protein